jgi:hypothetical protein
MPRSEVSAVLGVLGVLAAAAADLVLALGDVRVPARVVWWLSYSGAARAWRRALP